MKKAKVGLISLGCPKNLVDSEYMLGSLLAEGYEVTPSLEEAKIVIINTCAFIEPAQEEAVETILEVAQQKGDKKLVVAGCLASLFKKKLFAEIPQIDALLNPPNTRKIGAACQRILQGETQVTYLSSRDKLWDEEGPPRLISTPRHFAYLKIAEGCQNYCSYCIIPYLRGTYRSRTVESIIEEAKILAQAGVKEVNLTAQDTTLYGEDIYGQRRLPHLLDKLSEIPEFQWIRILYTHPAHFTEELIKTIAENKKVCNYLDIPLQHISDSILKLMGRKVTQKEIKELLYTLRENIPYLTLRTTFLVGFPGEGEAEFGELADFVKEEQFDHVGVFTYSPQEGTPSRKFKPQVPAETKQKRVQKLMTLQKGISSRKNKRFLGKTIKVLVDEKKGSNLYIGRREGDAPEIDGMVILKGKTEAGQFCEVKITKTGIYELEGEVVNYQ